MPLIDDLVARRGSLRRPLIDDLAAPQASFGARNLNVGVLGAQASGNDLLSAGATLVGANDYAAQQAAQADALRQQAGQIQTDTPLFTDLARDPSLEGAARFVGGNLAQQVPNIGLTVGAGALGSQAGGVLRRISPGLTSAQAAVRGATIGASGAEGGQIAGETFGQIRGDATAQGREVSAGDAGLALGTGAAGALVGGAANARLFGGIANGAGGTLRERLTRRALDPRQGFAEAAAEGTQGALQLGAREVANPNAVDLFSAKSLEDLINQSATGFTVGQTMNIGGGLLEGGARQPRAAVDPLTGAVQYSQADQTPLDRDALKGFLARGLKDEYRNDPDAEAFLDQFADQMIAVSAIPDAAEKQAALDDLRKAYSNALDTKRLFGAAEDATEDATRTAAVGDIDEDSPDAPLEDLAFGNGGTAIEATDDVFENRLYDDGPELKTRIQELETKARADHRAALAKTIETPATKPGSTPTPAANVGTDLDTQERLTPRTTSFRKGKAADVIKNQVDAALGPQSSDTDRAVAYAQAALPTVRSMAYGDTGAKIAGGEQYAAAIEAFETAQESLAKGVKSNKPAVVAQRTTELRAAADKLYATLGDKQVVSRRRQAGESDAFKNLSTRLESEPGLIKPRTRPAVQNLAKNEAKGHRVLADGKMLWKGWLPTTDGSQVDVQKAVKRVINDPRVKQNLPKREGGNFKLLAGDLFAAAGSTLSDAGVNIDYKSVPDEHVIMQFDGKPVTYGELKKLSAAQTLQNRQDDAQEGADDEWSIADISGKEGQPRTGPMTGINRNDELVGTFNEPTTDDATETKKNREDRDVRLVQADAAAASIQPKLKSLRGLIKRLRSDNTLTREGIRAEYDKLTNELGYAPASGLVDPAAKPTRKDFENELIGLGTRLKEILDTKEAAAKQVTAPPWEQPKRVEMRDRQGKNATPADTTSPKILAAEAKRTAATRETKTEKTVAEKGVTAFAQDVANTIQAKRDQGTVYSRIAADVQRRLGKSGISAAHASPHRHEGRFSWRQHKGKGEGNAAFGAGTYLSTDDGVNASYINQFSPRSKKGLNDTAASLMASADDNVEAAIKKAEESIAYNEQVVERLFATISDGQFKEVKNSEGRSYWVREGADHFRLTIVPKKSLLKTEYVLRAPNDTDQSSVMMVESGTFSSFKEAAAAGSALAYNADMRAVYSREKNIEALKDAIEELKAYTPNQKKEPVTYHVTINATDDEILDWNTPLREQSQRVQDAVDAALPADKEGSWVDGKSAVTGGNVSTRGDFKIFEKDDKFEATHMGSNSKLGRLGKYDSLAEAKKAVRKIATATMTGREVYLVLQKKLGSDVDASIALADAGIVGHKFAASGGRNDTHPNYVIYADERIQTNYVTFGKVDYKSWLEFTPEQRAVYSMLYGDPATANPAGSWAQSDVTGAKLNKLTEAWAGNLGIKAPRVITDKAEAAKFGDTNSLGFYNDKNGVVYINDTYSAEVQLETLAHEVGHGVFRQIKMSGPEAAAIKTAYEAWRAQQAGKTKSQVRASRSTAAVNALVLNENGKAPDWYDLDFEEWFADNVGRWLTTDAKPLTAVDRFFAKIANAIRTLAGFLKTQGYTPSADTAVAALMDKLYGGHNAQSHYATLDDYYSNQPRGVLYNLAIGMQSPGGSATAKQVFQALTPEQRRTVGNAFGQGSARGRLVELLRADGRGAEARMVLSGDTATAWGWGVHYWKKGTLKVGAALDNVITQQETALRKALGTLSEGERANEILTAVVNQNLTAATGAAYGNQGRVQKAAAATMKTIDKLMPLMNFMTVAQERMYATQNPVLIDIANKLAVRTGEAGRGESYVEAQQAQSLKRMNKVATIIEGMSDADKKTTVDALKTGKMPTTLQQAGVMSSLTNWFNDAHAYGSNVDPNLPKIDGYFPVVYDTDKLADKRAEFADMLAEDRFKDALGDLTKLSTTERADPAIRRAKAGQLVDYMVQNMTAEGSTVIQEPTPYFSHGQKRTLDFIRTLGTDADRQLWADVQSDDLLATMNGYTRGLTRRTEYLRRFPVEVDPVTGQVLRRELDVQLNSAAKDYGASAKDIELANDYVSALLGTYGLNDRPKMLTKLTDALDKLGVFGTDWSKNPAKLRKVMGVVMMYQNVRLLALSGLSSVVDFAGIAMRTDLTSAMEGLREGVRQAKAAYQKTGPTGYRQMAETLGVVDKAGLEEAILQTYAAADIGPLARKVNDFLFRWNGLNGLTRAMRVMSLAAAETYVARQMVNTPAARYELQKLNITHDDVRAKNEDYMRALNRLVNEATIRPNAAQRPLWGSHPDFMLVFHLKQFMFSMHDRIIRQMVSQVREGNTVPMQSVVWYGLLGLAVDTISDEIRMGGDDDEEKAKYGWNDYMTAAMERSGLNGMGQVFNDMRKNLLYGGTGVEELTGPTGTQAAQWFRAIFGDGSASSAALSSLPASQLFKGLVNRVD